MSRELWKRRLGPLWGGAVALSASSAFPIPGIDTREDAPTATWMVVSGAPLGAIGAAVAAAAAAIGAPSSIAATLGALAMIGASGVVIERAVGALATRAADSAAGTVAICAAVILKVQLLGAIAPEALLVAFLGAAIVGRWSAAFLQGLGDPIIDPPARSLVSAPPPAWELAALTGAVAVLAFFALGAVALLAMGVSAGAAFAFGLAAQRRRGGLDANVVGATALVGELAVLVAAALR